MALITGSAFGTITTQTEDYIEGAPQIYFADINAPYMYTGVAGDGQAFFWNITGSATYPVYQLGCYEGVSLSDNLDINSVRCDVVGDKDVIIRRNFLELRFTLKSFFPLSVIAPFFGTHPSSVVTNATEQTQKFGIGSYDNARYYKVYLPKVYDETNGDYVSITGHRCKLMTSGEVSMTYGNVWSIPVVIRMLADESKPTGQLYATVVRADAAAL